MIIPIKLIGCGIAVVFLGVGAGSLIKYPRYEYSKTIGQVSAEHTTDAQWRFLYLLAGKVFEYLKKKDSEDKTGTKDKTSVIEWLKYKFNNTKTNNLNNWEGFKDLCSQELIKENKIDWNEVSRPEVRLCFMGASGLDKENQPSAISLQLYVAHKKGDLSSWYRARKNESSEGNQNENNYQNFNAFKDDSWNKTNWDLYIDFEKNNKDNSDFETFKSKWDSWCNTAETISSNPEESERDTDSSSNKKLCELLKVDDEK